MQINLDQLRSHLMQQLRPIYLVQGDDSLLVQDACRAIGQKAKQLGFSDRLKFTIDNSSQWAMLNEHLLNYSLFADQQLIELRCETVPNANLTQGLKAYAADPIKEKLLLVVCPKLTAAQLQSAWVQTIAKQGTVVNVWPLAPKQLPEWIEQRAKALNIQFAPEALHLLCEYCSGNLLAARQLLEKLRLLAPSKMISLDLVQQLLNDSAKYSVFDLVDACLMGEVKLGLRILKKLQEENTEPVLALWALAREWRELANLSEEMQTTTNLHSLLTQRRVNSKKIAAYSQLLRQTHPLFWYELLAQGAHVDEIIKGALPGNVWDGLCSMCLQFANRTSLSCSPLLS